MDGVEPGLEVEIASPPIEPNVAQSEDEQPLPSPVALSADAIGGHSSIRVGKTVNICKG